MLGKFRSLAIVWLVTALLVLINLSTSGNFSGEIVFFLINVVTIIFALSVSSSKLIKH